MVIDTGIDSVALSKDTSEVVEGFARCPWGLKEAPAFQERIKGILRAFPPENPGKMNDSRRKINAKLTAFAWNDEFVYVTNKQGSTRKIDYKDFARAMVQGSTKHLGGCK